MVVRFAPGGISAARTPHRPEFCGGRREGAFFTKSSLLRSYSPSSSSFFSSKGSRPSSVRRRTSLRAFSNCSRQERESVSPSLYKRTLSSSGSSPFSSAAILEGRGFLGGHAGSYCLGTRERGSTATPRILTPRCRCGPVTRPVAPTRPICCPALTISPGFTSRRDMCA